MTDTSRKTTLAVACVLIAAIAAGGGYWLHRQQRELAWSVLYDTLGKTNDELTHTEDSYSLLSQTLTVKNLKLRDADEKSVQPAPADEAAANDGSTPAQFFLQAASVTLTGAGHVELPGEAVYVPRFDALVMENVSVYPGPGDTVTVDSLSVGPVTGKLALLNNYFSPEPDTDFSELEKTMELFSLRKLRLSGVKVHSTSGSGAVPPFILSFAEITQDHISMKDSGPLLAKELHWETSPASDAFPLGRQQYFSSVKAEALELDRVWVADPKAALPIEYYAAAPEKFAWLKNFYATGEMGIRGLRLRGIQVVYAMFGFQVKEVDFSFSQKNGKADITGAVTDLNVGRMVNHILLERIPALKAIPDAANLPLSVSCNVSSTQFYSSGSSDTSSIQCTFGDILELRMATEAASGRGDDEADEFLEAWTDGENPYLAGFRAGFYGEQHIRSLTYTITDHTFTDYLYRVLAAKAGTTPEREKERILARLEQGASHPEFGDLLSQPALKSFFADSGTLQVRLTAKNGTVPFSWDRQDEFSLSLFSMTSAHTPRGSETP